MEELAKFITLSFDAYVLPIIAFAFGLLMAAIVIVPAIAVAAGLFSKEVKKIFDANCKSFGFGVFDYIKPFAIIFVIFAAGISLNDSPVPDKPSTLKFKNDSFQLLQDGKMTELEKLTLQQSGNFSDRFYRAQVKTVGKINAIKNYTVGSILKDGSINLRA